MGERPIRAEVLRGILKGVGEEAAGRLAEPLRALGLPAAPPFAAVYPAKLIFEAIDLAARTAWPNLPPEEAQRQVGRAFFTGYTQTTLMGRSVRALMRVIGPRRSLLRLPELLQVGGEFGTVTAVARGPTHGELQCSTSPRPYFRQGVLLGLLEACGARDVQVEAPAEHPEGWTTYAVRWED